MTVFAELKALQFVQNGSIPLIEASGEFKPLTSFVRLMDPFELW